MADRQTIRDAAPVTPDNPAAIPRLMRLVHGGWSPGWRRAPPPSCGSTRSCCGWRSCCSPSWTGSAPWRTPPCGCSPRAEPYEGKEPARDWSQFAAYVAIGLALMALGWLTGASAGGIGAWPIAVGGIGSLILWQQADPDRRQRWMSARRSGRCAELGAHLHRGAARRRRVRSASWRASGERPGQVRASCSPRSSCGGVG